jgi:G3E family GTPase
VTVVDAVNGASTLDQHEEAVRQVAVADRLVLTKTDLGGAGPGLEALARPAERLNPSASIINAVGGASRPMRCSPRGSSTPPASPPRSASGCRPKRSKKASGGATRTATIITGMGITTM